VEEPLRQIVQNTGEDAAVVLNNVKSGKGSYGYSAASVAGLLLTTEVMIAEAPKGESDHVHPVPGGMGPCALGKPADARGPASS
jgi:chaperonin GroEL